jgi:transmembrane sensor
MTRWSKALTNQVDAAKIEAGWERVRARRSRPRAVRRAAVAAPIVALAAAIVLLVRTLLAPAPAPPAPTAPVAQGPTTARGAVRPIALADGAPLPTEWAPAPAPVTVALDDGSRLEIVEGTRLVRGAGAPDRVELAVERGRATFDVKPNGPRAWVIDAGDVVVKVLGTRFTVARDGDAVEVSVERGKVKVETKEGARILTAGQSFRTTRANATPDASAHAETNAKAPAPTPAPVRAPAPAPAPDPAPVSVQAADPMSQADALRRSGSASSAVQVLRDVVDAGDARAPLAAFTIGKIHVEDLHDEAGAARWFERSIALGLPSGLDEEAHARAVECWARAGSRSEAARAAARYEARFPRGRHLARVKEWAHD